MGFLISVFCCLQAMQIIGLFKQNMIILMNFHRVFIETVLPFFNKIETGECYTVGFKKFTDLYSIIFALCTRQYHGKFNWEHKLLETKYPQKLALL